MPAGIIIWAWCCYWNSELLLWKIQWFETEKKSFTMSDFQFQNANKKLNYQIVYNSRARNEKRLPPRRGIEPRSPAWQAGILTSLLSRIKWYFVEFFSNLHNHALIALLEERWTQVREVPGSNPGRGINGTLWKIPVVFLLFIKKSDIWLFYIWRQNLCWKLISILYSNSLFQYIVVHSNIKGLIDSVR